MIFWIDEGCPHLAPCAETIVHYGSNDHNENYGRYRIALYERHCFGELPRAYAHTSLAGSNLPAQDRIRLSAW